MENLNQLLKLLLESQIDFVLIGGYAAVLHGSSQVTQDIDICAVMTETNLEKLRTALRDLDPKYRMNPNYQPNLRTNSGVLDIINEVRPVGPSKGSSDAQGA